MIVPETEEALRAALTAAGVKPMMCQEKGKKNKTEFQKNKLLLQKVAEAQGRRLVLVAPGPSVKEIVEDVPWASSSEEMERIEAAAATAAKKKTAPPSKEGADGNKKAAASASPRTAAAAAAAANKKAQAQPGTP